jgi:uncharacterized protein with PIN domain
MTETDTDVREPRPGVSLAWFRFYEELNDFLPPGRRKRRFSQVFTRRASVKDMIEALGVPHTEIEVILANGESVDFSYIVTNGDDISVYPMFESLDVRPLLKLRPQPLRNPRYVLDTHLGRLARYLRLLGFDCLYQNDFHDDDLARISSEHDRILLTRDRRLLRRKIITRGYCVRATNPLLQTVEILRRFDLVADIRPLGRCIRCNGRLEDVGKDRIIDRLEPRTRRYYEDFRTCRDCGQIYWRGSHFSKMTRLIAALRAEAEREAVPDRHP